MGKATKSPDSDHRSRRWAEPAFHTRLDHVEKLRFLVAPKDAPPEPGPEGKPGPAPIPDLATAALVGAGRAEPMQHAVRAIPEPGVPLFAQEHHGKLPEMEI